MNKPNVIARTLLAVLAVGQFSWMGVALAEDQPTVTPTPAATAAPSPTITPEPSVTPEPTPAPEPTVSPEPTSTPEPTATPTPAPSADTTSADEPKKKDKPSYSKPGVDGCVGIVPKWVYDTTISQWAPADQGSFTCDAKTGYYLSPKYIYDKSSGWYEIVAPNTPLTENQLTAPNVVHTVLGDLTVGSTDYQVAQALGLLSPTGGIVTANTGGAAGASAVPVTSGGNQTWFDLTNLVNVINTLQTTATSGDVTATKNTEVGSAVTGAAGVLANLINLLASAWSWSNGSLNFFMQNLVGNLSGDLHLNPTETATGGGGSMGSVNANANGAGSSNEIGLGDSSTLGVNAQNQGNIVNNVDALAQSGDATVTKNTQAGNVATGQALAEVNIINLINSFINSGSSFFGILNIFGNLNGDILFPEGFLNGAVASGSGATGVSANANGPGSANTVGVDASGSTTVNNNVYNGVANNISTTAASGTATADKNSGVGSVSTGDATTTQGLFNIANSSIFGDNAVLVIVNVLGHWVGKIMTLPGAGGATQSALLTGNAQVSANANGADSNNQIGLNGGGNTTLNNNSVGTITNNVNVHAQSGDATATQNTGVGDVSTGDAKAATSVANIFNTVLNVKHWFGVLVINVFGDWLGDVNNNTSAGDANPTLAATATAAQQATATSVPKVGLLGLANAGSVAGAQIAAAQVANNNVGATTTGPVLTAAAHQTNAAQVQSQAQTRDMTFMFIISAVLMLVAGMLASLERRAKRA